MLTGRIPRFEQIVAETIDYLRTRSPEEMAGVRVQVAAMPPELQHPQEGIDRWRVVAPKGIVLYRVPIDRLAKLHCSAPVHYRMHVERIVLEAVGELLGRDPRDILPEAFDED